MPFLKNYFAELIQLLIKFNFFKNLSYFVSYYDTVKKLKSGKKLQIIQIYLVNFIILVRAVHLTIFTFVSFSFHSNLLQFNFVYLEGLDPNHNIVFAIFYVLSVYYTKIFYFSNQSLILDIIKDILIHGKNTFFLSCSLKNVKLGKWENNKLFLYVYNSENISANIQRIAIIWRNALQIFYYVIGISVFINTILKLIKFFRYLFCRKAICFTYIFLGKFIFYDNCWAT